MKNNIIEYLSKVSFFSRFSKEQIRTMIPIIQLQIFDKNDVLFTQHKNVYVIIHGDVVLKSHQNHSFPAKLIAGYRQGAIIGSDYESKSNE